MDNLKHQSTELQLALSEYGVEIGQLPLPVFYLRTATAYYMGLTPEQAIAVWHGHSKSDQHKILAWGKLG